MIMAATQNMIKEWFIRGKDDGYSHMIVVCDTFSYEDYPEYVHGEDNTRKKVIDIHKESMQRVMGVYNLNMDMEKQINSHRCFNY